MSSHFLLRTLALGAAVAAVATAPATAATSCANPTGTGEFQRVAPAAVGLDGVKLSKTLNFFTSRGSASVRVYRHGCLAATSSLDPFTQSTPANVWSTTKGITSLLTGLAVTDGKLALDDPIGKYLPQADAAHGKITVRQLLTQTSGLRFAWLSDATSRDQVKYTLSLPFVHAPGTYFEYAQTTVTLLGAVVQAAVGEDLARFADRRLFTPLGITHSSWSWPRDRAGHVQGWAFLNLAPKAMGRVGQLLLQRGAWNGQQLIAADYIQQLQAPSATNPGYGFLAWTNGGGSMITATMPSRRFINEPFLPTAPADTYAFVGFLGQLIIVVPSLDMVIVRTGLPGNRDPDLHSLLTVKSGDMDYEGIRGVMQSVTDVAVPDPGPYRSVVHFEPFDGSRIFDLTTLQLAGRS